MAQIFPKWSNQVPKVLLPVLMALVSSVVFVFWYWFSPRNLEVGYQPVQPISYSHKLHAGQLGIDCRYCHNNVERSPFAGVPPTQTCMNCHATVKADSLKLENLMASWKSGHSVEWVRIHKLPDYVYFDHSVHLAAGVSCVNCHGRIDQMEVVSQVEPLNMEWCLECHRNPARALWPKENVTDLAFKPSAEWVKIAEQKAHDMNAPVESCSGCHR